MWKLTFGLRSDYIWYGRDFSAFDGSIAERLQMMAAEVLFECIDYSTCSVGCGGSMLRRAMTTLTKALSHAWILTPWGEAYKARQGLKSGIYLTSLLGSSVHHMMISACFHWIIHTELSPEQHDAVASLVGVCSADAVVDYVIISVISDDVRLGVPARLLEYFPIHLQDKFLTQVAGFMIKWSDANAARLARHPGECEYNSRYAKMVRGVYVSYAQAHRAMTTVLYVER